MAGTGTTAHPTILILVPAGEFRDRLRRVCEHRGWRTVGGEDDNPSPDLVIADRKARSARTSLHSGRPVPWIRIASATDVPDGHELPGLVTVLDRASSETVIATVIASALELCRSTGLYRDVFENALVGLCLHELVIDDRGTPVDAVYYDINRSFEQQMGLARATVVGKTMRELFGGGAAIEGLIAAYGAVVLQDEGYTDEIFFAPLDRWFRVNAFNSRDRFFTASFQDVTAERRRRDLLAEREENYRRLFFEHAAVKLVIDPVSGEIQEANRAAERFYGWSQDELVGMPIAAINVSPVEEIESQMDLAVKNRRNRFLFQHRLRDGSIRDVEILSNGISMGDRTLLHSVVVDVTDRFQAQEEIAERERFLQALFETSHDGIMITAADGSIIEVNDAFCRLTGYSKEELCGMTPAQLDVRESPEGMAKRIERMRGSGGERLETQYRQKSGELVNVEVTISFVDHLGGRFVTINRDISDRKRREEVERELLREKEILLGEVQHRTKNDMYLVSALLSLQAQEADHPEVRQAIEDASARVRTLSQVYQQLYQGSNVQTVELRPLVVRICEQVASLGQSRQVEIQPIVAEVCVPTRLSVSLGLMINEVLTNSVKHAFDTTTTPRIFLKVEGDESRLKLSIADNGRGYPKEAIAGGSSSHGLGIVRALTDQHGGDLSLRNDNGAVTEVTLPLHGDDLECGG